MTIVAAAHAADGSIGWYRAFVFLTALDLALATFTLCMGGLTGIALVMLPEYAKFKRVRKPSLTVLTRLVSVAYDLGMTVYMAYLGWYWLWVAWFVITVMYAAVGVLFYEILGKRIFIGQEDEESENSDPVS